MTSISFKKKIFHASRHLAYQKMNFRQIKKSARRQLLRAKLQNEKKTCVDLSLSTFHDKNLKPTDSRNSAQSIEVRRKLIVGRLEGRIAA